MKKIMFNDRYGLTQAVIEGRKTMTRRLADPKRKYEELRLWQPCLELEYGLYGCTEDEFWEYIEAHYHFGEIVAVAQNYEQIELPPQYILIESHGCVEIEKSKGYRNKMYVQSRLMPYQIRITGIKCERLYDISEADCLKEGVRVEFVRNDVPRYYYLDFKRQIKVWFDTPREAFASLIDKVSGYGTWQRNPWVVVYEFELVK